MILFYYNQIVLWYRISFIHIHVIYKPVKSLVSNCTRRLTITPLDSLHPGILSTWTSSFCMVELDGELLPSADKELLALMYHSNRACWHNEDTDWAASVEFFTGELSSLLLLLLLLLRMFELSVDELMESREVSLRSNSSSHPLLVLINRYS